MSANKFHTHTKQPAKLSLTSQILRNFSLANRQQKYAILTHQMSIYNSDTKNNNGEKKVCLKREM